MDYDGGTKHPGRRPGKGIADWRYSERLLLQPGWLGDKRNEWDGSCLMTGEGNTALSLFFWICLGQRALSFLCKDIPRTNCPNFSTLLDLDVERPDLGFS